MASSALQPTYWPTSLGALEYVVKPVSQAQLQETLSPVEEMQPGKLVRGERMWRGEVGLESIRVINKGKRAKMERVKVCMMDMM